MHCALLKSSSQQQCVGCQQERCQMLPAEGKGNHPHWDWKVLRLFYSNRYFPSKRIPLLVKVMTFVRNIYPSRNANKNNRGKKKKKNKPPRTLSGSPWKQIAHSLLPKDNKRVALQKLFIEHTSPLPFSSSSLRFEFYCFHSSTWPVIQALLIFSIFRIFAFQKKKSVYKSKSMGALRQHTKWSSFTNEFSFCWAFTTTMI